MLRACFAAMAIAFGATAVVAQSTPQEQRNALMSSMWRDGWRAIAMMARGREPYEQAKVDAGFAKLTEIAPKLPPLWPEGSQGVAPGARFASAAKIWENKADFEAKLAAFVKAVQENRGKAKDLDTLKVAYEAVNTACDNCHEVYRMRVER
ncbi:MAG TPA: cytochrome c [Xanthobacteraceae bacterium]|nr:cytochrome c [Xanthobacteraceae bacterium]